MKYTVYFEIYGKKLKTEVNAKNEMEAKETIKNKIIFHKLESGQNLDTLEKEFYDLCDKLGIDPKKNSASKQF